MATSRLKAWLIILVSLGSVKLSLSWGFWARPEPIPSCESLGHNQQHFMSHNYYFRSHKHGLHNDPSVDESKALSSPAPQSSPDQLLCFDGWNIPDDVPFIDISGDALSEDKITDPNYIYASTNPQKPRLTNLEKVLQILAYIKTSFLWFSLWLLQETLFESNNPTIKHWANIFWRTAGIYT
ncbi:hypothetical protein B0H34DRAFT_674969 [Crassisporium funariophilum]|nr:hypothetical protein B0H34DRAFT_674969 [Crassisporium funariophilum]